MTNLRIATATLVLAALTACEKPAEPTVAPPADDSGAVPAAGDDAVAADDGAAEEREPGAPGVAWADKSFDEKKTWMGIEVYPAMKKDFQAHDGAAYKKFTCDTCHGDDGKATGYKMPSDSIYPLNPADPIKGAMEYDEAVTKFMVETVTPNMIAMLEGTQAASADHPDGFSCMSCHPAE